MVRGSHLRWKEPKQTHCQPLALKWKRHLGHGQCGGLKAERLHSIGSGTLHGAGHQHSSPHNQRATVPGRSSKNEDLITRCPFRVMRSGGALPFPAHLEDLATGGSLATRSLSRDACLDDSRTPKVARGGSIFRPAWLGALPALPRSSPETRNPA